MSRAGILFLGLLLACIAGSLAPANPAAQDPRTLLEADHWEEALALTRDRRDPEGVTLYGMALYRAGRLEEAEQVLRQVVERSPGEPPARALVQLGLLASARGRAEEGAVLLRRGRKAAPDDPWVLYWTAGAEGTLAAAIADLERYLELAGKDHPDRAEGVRGTIRFYRALGDRDLWIRSERPERAEIPLKRLPDGRGGTRSWILKAGIGSRRKPVPLLLDSGSPGLYLQKKIARKAGIELLSQETVFGGGGTGRHPIDKGVLSRFTLGSLGFRDALGSVSQRRLDPGGGFQGLIGTRVFAGYAVTLDLRDGELLLEPPGAEPDRAAWGEGVPYWVLSGQLLVRAGDRSGVSGLFLLDTGASRTVLSRRFTEQVSGVSIRRGGRTRGYGGLRNDRTEARGVHLEFLGLEGSGRPLPVVDLGLRSRMAGAEISGFLGLDLLNGHRIRIDPDRRRVYVRTGGDESNE